MYEVTSFLLSLATRRWSMVITTADGDGDDDDENDDDDSDDVLLYFIIGQKWTENKPTNHPPVHPSVEIILSTSNHPPVHPPIR